VPEIRLDLVACEEVANRHHRDQEHADRNVDCARGQEQQRARAERRGGNAGQRIGRAGAPVDLPPPRRDARDVRQHGRDRHDRQNGAGDQAGDEDEQDAQ